MLLIRVLILQGVLIFQGTISPLAEGTCGLRGACRIEQVTVDAFSGVQARAQCASSEGWYIRRYMSNALEPRVSEIMFNDSFMNQNGALTISHVNGDAEGSYHCGMSAPASLCLLVRGRPFFASCPGDFVPSPDNAKVTYCNRTVNIDRKAGCDVILNTTVKFENGGFCNETQGIRLFNVTRNEVSVFRCSNLGTTMNRLCFNASKFSVLQQEPCDPQAADIRLCKFNMILVLMNFTEADEGVYEVTLDYFQNVNTAVEMRQRFNLTLSDRSCEDTTPPTTPASTTATTKTDVGSTDTLRDNVPGIVGGTIGGIIILLLLLLGVVLLVYLMLKTGRIMSFEKGKRSVDTETNNLREMTRLSYIETVDLPDNEKLESAVKVI